MTDPDQGSTPLRRERARAILHDASVDLAEFSPEDIQALFEELQLYQMELELQNEELRQSQRKLEAARSRYADLYDFAPVGYLSINEQGLIVETNLTAVSMLGVERSRLINRALSRFVAKEHQDAYYSWKRRLFTTRQPHSCEVRLVRPDGARFYAELNGIFSQYDEEEDNCYRLTISDITESKQASLELQLLHTITRKISAAPDLQAALAIVLSEVVEATGWDFAEAWLPDGKRQVLTCSPVWSSSNYERLAEFRQNSEMISFPRNVGLPGRVWASKQAEWVADISNAPAGEFPRVSLSLKAGLKAGWGLPLMANEQVLAVLAFFMFESGPEDSRLVELISAVAAQLGAIFERKRIEEEKSRLLKAIKTQRERLRALTRRLTEVEEAERQRLNRELHDQVGQNLTALDLNLNVIRSQLAGDSALTGVVHNRLNDSLALVEQTTEQVRNVMADLRPPVLDDYGLAAALEWYGSHFAERFGLTVTVRNGSSVFRLASSIETALFRIAQEALTNVAKYARAGQVTLTITVDKEKVRLVIADDGIGFEVKGPAEFSQPNGWGLLTMAERAEGIGGRCQIESAPGQGTRVIVEVGI